MKKYQVRITSEEKDIENIYDYIAKYDISQNTEYVLDKLEEMIFSLNEVPERGNYPPEPGRHGIREFREVMFKPYRTIYEISGNNVIVHLCVDGHRDMIALLERKLLR